LKEARNGWVIRWWEVEIAPDGSRQKALRYERLGPMSRKQAAERLSQRTAAAGNARAVRSRVAFRTLVTEWEQSILPKYKPSTQKHRRFMLKKHLLPAFGDRAVCEIARQDIQLQAAGTSSGNVAHVPAHVLFLVSSTRRTGQGDGAAHGPRERRHDDQCVHAGARRLGSGRRRARRKSIERN